MRDLEGAVEWGGIAQEYSDGATATYNGVLARQTIALATLAQIPAGSPGHAEAVAQVAPHLEQLRIWRASSEENHAHRVLLIEGEIARLEGRVEDALDNYDRAIELAHEERFLHDEAIGKELAGRFYLERGKSTPGRAYLNEALATYERWGAARKCAALREEFSTLLS